MNRHRSNWSAMGCGLTDSSYLKVKSVEECREHIEKIINYSNFKDSINNIVKAIIEIKEER